MNSYHEEGSLQTMGNTLISGTYTREQVAESAGGIFDVFPNGLKFVITGLVVDEHKAAVEATSEGEHISGETYSNEYHFLFIFKDNKLLRLKEYMDNRARNRYTLRWPTPRNVNKISMELARGETQWIVEMF